jgi:hypothetical protein
MHPHANAPTRVVGDPESAGINRHVVGDERALQERKQRIHPGLESCSRHREMSLEAETGVSVGRLLSFEKPKEQDADFVPVGRKATRQPR